MKTLLKTRKNEVGATAIEYGLIAALISVAIIGAVSALGTDLKSVFTSVGSTLSSASTAG
ncbi:Flp family type IVb pilin [Acetobacter okinawensis]|uniref:Flp family type IVb pilin n=1 Tax=Acetobacter okinawensis TaxID=1076594 RepID=UPI000A3A2D8E|nr:Flp family type IVb pilin [Acetobacter okinawensis]